MRTTILTLLFVCDALFAKIVHLGYFETSHCPPRTKDNPEIFATFWFAYRARKGHDLMYRRETLLSDRLAYHSLVIWMCPYPECSEDACTTRIHTI